MAEALVDSNVLIAALATEHDHHEASSDLLIDGLGDRFAAAAHSYSEVFNNLTKPRGLYRRSPTLVVESLNTLRGKARPLGLKPDRTFEAIAEFARMGGVGARLYDYLIGQCARQAGLLQIITWNVGHFRALFPDLDVRTPVEALRRL